MEHQEKNNIFQVPDGYFDSLPDRIMHSHSKARTRSIYRISFAAAAIVILSFALFVFRNDTLEVNNFDANLAAEVDMYINSGYWNAEDILSFSDNPDLILDEIIAAEWSYILEEDQGFEEDLWF